MSDSFKTAIETLRGGLPALETTPNLADIQRGRDEVYARFGPLFAPDHLPHLTAEEFAPLLDFKVNRHWSGIHRHKNRLTKDMNLLRQALLKLTDERLPLAQRYDSALSLVNGLGQATATPILHVAHPEKYGVYNAKAKAGLRKLGIFPSLKNTASEGEQYAAVNDVLCRLSAELGIDLWTLDTLWEWLGSSDPNPNRRVPPSDPSIADEFRGFTADAFAFLSELATNNNKAWMEANRDRWKSSVLEPMRALFTDLGPHVKELFDPYLQPDELEITPTAHKVLARINKNWTATPDSKYHEYYWGAFYRQGLFRQTDAQLFINIFSNVLRTGFYMGHKTDTAFQQRLQENPSGFLNLIAVAELSLEAGFIFERTHPDGVREPFAVKSAEDLEQWTSTNNFGFLRRLTPDQVVALGPALADTIFDTFRRVFPIYLWAVAGEPEPLIERYLAAEFPADDEDDDDPPPPPYTFADFTGNTHLTGSRAAELRDMLMDKRQAIFYGPPGTGKTFVARHLGRLLTGLADPPPDRLTVVQFHPAYGYEEFIEGIRPHSEKGDDGRAVIDYPVRPGAFVRFCRVAAQYGDQPCVFIIDEINRGNIPRIFGELMLLLEYRDQSVPLPYSGERFRIPRNVHVIGTMNTADRSIALVDFALRRRFHFARFTADPDLFDRWLEGRPTPSWLGALYRRLTDEAIDDAAYRIGPSVFMRDNLTEDGVRRAWEWSVLPWLREYYFDQPAKAGSWAWDGELLRGIRGEHGG